LLDQLDGHPKLTVAALHGTALGGGFETALSCHYRIALESAKVGLPEVKLGLLPGAGGTQRVPRLAGLEASINMMTTGNPVSAQLASTWSLVDRVVSGDLLDEAVRYAKTLVADQASHKQARAATFVLTQDDRDLLAKHRAQLLKKTRGENAPQRILSCIEAAAGLRKPSGWCCRRSLWDICCCR